MRIGWKLLASSALVGLLVAPDAAFAQRRGGPFVADNVLWLPEVFNALSAANKISVQDERQAEDAVFKKVQRALSRNNFGALTRAELGRILSFSNLNVNDRDLTPDDLDSTGPFAFAGLDRMVGVGVGSGSSFRVDLSQNLLPTFLVPTVSGGEISGYTSLDEVYSISRVLKGKGGAKIAKNGISFNAATGELSVTLRRPFGDKQFVNLLLELDDGSGSSKKKGGKRAATGPTIQVTFANMTNPIADEPIVVPGTFSGGTVTSNASDVESQVTADRPNNRQFMVAAQNVSTPFPGLNLNTGVVTDNNTSYTAVVTNGVLFKKFAVQVASPS